MEMALGIAPATKLTVVYVVVLFYMVAKQSNVTNVKCGFTMKAEKIDIFLIFVQNIDCGYTLEPPNDSNEYS